MTFWIIILLAISCSYEGVVTQAQPYIVTATTRTGSRKNTFFLRCQSGGAGSFVSNATFYRNGAPSGSDYCLKEYTTIFLNGSMHLHMIPSCEGYYQCGHNNILSSPVKVYAYPQLLPNTSRTSITLYAREGDNVKLPCPMDVSYFDQLNILWKINIFGQITQIPEPVNEDYSVTLSNVTVLRSGVYFCTARSKILSGGSSSLTGHQVNLIVQRKHESPQFLTNIIHIQDTNDNHIFRINAQGTQPLYFKWYLNTKCLNDSIQREISSPDGHTVKIRSEIKLSSLPSKTSQLSVIVSNEDGTKGQFIISKTGFLLQYESTPTMSPLPCHNDSQSIGSVVTEHTMMGEKEQIINITVLGTVSFTLFLLVIFLSCVVCYQRHIRKMCPNCTAGDTPISESTKKSPDYNSRDPKHTLFPYPSPIPDSLPFPDDRLPLPYTRPAYNQLVPYSHSHMIPGHPPFSTNRTIISSPLPPVPGQLPNPISIILLHIGYMYWDAKASDTTFLSSVQQILIRVLEEPEVISNHGARAFVKHLRDEIMAFADELREQRCRGVLSQQPTISSNGSIDNSIKLVDDSAERMKKSSNEKVKLQQNKSKGGTKSVNELGSGTTDCCSQMNAEATLEDLKIEETDGGVVHELEDTITTMKHLASVLTSWISVHDNVDKSDQVKT